MATRKPSERQRLRAQRRHLHTLARLAAATTPAARAAAEWDRVRALIGDLPADQRVTAWGAVTAALAAARTRLPGGDPQ